MGRDRELTDDQWAALARHLPPQRSGARGRPPKDHRTVVEAIVWRARTGAPWRDLPAACGPWQSVYARFRRWQLAGVWDRTLAALQAEADVRGNLDWTLHFLDGTVIRAHQHAAGAKKGAAGKPSAAAKAASRPRSTCAPRAAGDRSASS